MRGILAFILSFTLLGCDSLEPGAGDLLAHPDNSAAHVEYFVRKPPGDGPWPAVVFLHGHQPGDASIGGAAFVRWGVLDRYAARGFLAVSVSLPGYGHSGGPRDFAGPFAQHAVRAVIAKLVADRAATPGRIVIQGTSLGAVTAALIAAGGEALDGLVLISGLYDLPAFLSPPKTMAANDILAAVVAQTGGGDEALRARSALLVAGRIKASVLILNGAEDDRTDPEQAREFGDALNTGGGKAIVHIFPEFGHEIPVEVRQDEIDAFIDATLKPQK